MYHIRLSMLRPHLFLTAALLAGGSIPHALGAPVRTPHDPALQVRGPGAGAVVPGTVIVKFRADATVPPGGPRKAGTTLSPSLTRLGATSMRRMFPQPAALGKLPLRVF